MNESSRLPFTVPRLEPAIMWIIGICVVVFRLTASSPSLARLLVLSYRDVAPWQLLTAAFCHADLTHLFFNCFGIWMFGSVIERKLSTRRFVLFFLCCAVVPNVLWIGWVAVAASPAIQAMTSLVGASGALYGILYAYAYFFPDNVILVFFAFPVRAKILVTIYGALAFWNTLATPGDGIAHSVHLAGLLTAVVFLEFQQGGRLSKWLASHRSAFDFWRRSRHLTVIPGKKKPSSAADDEPAEPSILGRPFFRSDDDDPSGPIIN